MPRAETQQRIPGLALKSSVKEHWEAEVCGSRYGGSHADRRKYFAEIDQSRYRLEYMLEDFARFEESGGKKVLEVGLGTGADFVRWVREGTNASGRDLTDASLALVNERLSLEGLQADVACGDAEDLEFADNTFDIFYSWGVLHHTPNTRKSFAEAYRVLKPGGTLKAMIYHYPSVSAFMIWFLYGVLRLRFRGPRACYAENVESPGTKLYTVREARALVGSVFTDSPVEIRTYLAAGADLLTHELSAKYSDTKWKLLKAIFPRWFVKGVVGHRLGTIMTIEAIK